MLLPHRTGHRGFQNSVGESPFRALLLMLSGAKVQRNNERIIEIDANSSEYAKKMQKSLAVCENMYNFAAVFQIYVNKEQCYNKE